LKEKVIYKSSSFSLNLFIFFLGFVFFNLMIWLTTKGLNSNIDKNARIAMYVIDFVFLIFSLGSLYYFLKTQIVKLTNKHLIISYQFLPFSKKILIEDIKGFIQTQKSIIYSNRLFDKGLEIYTIFEIFINLKDGKKIKTYSLSDYDYKEIQKLTEKIKRGEGKFQVEKISNIELVIKNIPMILFLIMMFILIGGLSNALIFN